MLAWDPSDDNTLETLARGAWWDEARLEVLRGIFAQLDSGDAEYPSLDALGRLLIKRGMDPAEVPDICRAMCRRADGRLDLEAFQIGMMALDPHTTHGGLWNGIRAQCALAPPAPRPFLLARGMSLRDVGCGWRPARLHRSAKRERAIGANACTCIACPKHGYRRACPPPPPTPGTSSANSMRTARAICLMHSVSGWWRRCTQPSAGRRWTSRRSPKQHTPYGRGWLAR